MRRPNVCVPLDEWCPSCGFIAVYRVSDSRGTGHPVSTNSGFTSVTCAACGRHKSGRSSVTTVKDFFAPPESAA